MAQLRQDYDRFQELDTVILVVGPENAAAFQEYFTKHDLPFIGLPDPGHSVLRLYGQEVNLFKLGRMPAMVVIDRGGNVRFAHYGHNISDIPENQDILETLRSLDQGQ